MTDPVDTVKDAALRPRQATGDNGSFQEHSLQEQIAAAKFLAAQEAMKAGKKGFKISGFVPGSSVGGLR